jgi:hypothetical protein
MSELRGWMIYSWDRAPDGDVWRLLPSPTLKQGQCHDTVSPN